MFFGKEPVARASGSGRRVRPSDHLIKRPTIHRPSITGPSALRASDYTNPHLMKNPLTVLLALLALGAGAAAALSARDTRPNIVFIIADDMHADMLNYTAAGRGRNLTPHLDRLAAEGTVMQEQHIVSPVCTPSRYNCLTGRYASRATNPLFTRQSERAGMTIVTWNSKLMPGDVTLPKLLQQAGYVTGIAGKQHVVDVPGRQRPPADADPRAPGIKAMLALNGASCDET